MTLSEMDADERGAIQAREDREETVEFRRSLLWVPLFFLLGLGALLVVLMRIFGN